MSTAAANQQAAKSRNSGAPGGGAQFKTTAAAVGLSLGAGSTKGIGKTMLMGQQTTSNSQQPPNMFLDQTPQQV
jgi:hypothetical protein